MRVVCHPEFAVDLRNFRAEYSLISIGLGLRFGREVDEVIKRVKVSRGGAGHFLTIGSATLSNFRRANLRSFPFFVLYSAVEDQLLSVRSFRAAPIL
jgi:hypothetical protein